MRTRVAFVFGVLTVLVAAGPADAFVGTETFTYTFADFTYTVVFEAVSARRANVTIDVSDASGHRAHFEGRAREIQPVPFLPVRVATGDINNDGVIDEAKVSLPRRLARPFAARSTEALARKFANRARGIIAILVG